MGSVVSSSSYLITPPLFKVWQTPETGEKSSDKQLSIDMLFLYNLYTHTQLSKLVIGHWYKHITCIRSFIWNGLRFLVWLCGLRIYKEPKIIINRGTGTGGRIEYDRIIMWAKGICEYRLLLWAKSTKEVLQVLKLAHKARYHLVDACI